MSRARGTDFAVKVTAATAALVPLYLSWDQIAARIPLLRAPSAQLALVVGTAYAASGNVRATLAALGLLGAAVLLEEEEDEGA